MGQRNEMTIIRSKRHAAGGSVHLLPLRFVPARVLQERTKDLASGLRSPMNNH